jgi:hypothetical protein
MTQPSFHSGTTTAFGQGMQGLALAAEVAEFPLSLDPPAILGRVFLARFLHEAQGRRRQPVKDDE